MADLGKQSSDFDNQINAIADKTGYDTNTPDQEADYDRQMAALKEQSGPIFSALQSLRANYNKVRSNVLSTGPVPTSENEAIRVRLTKKFLDENASNLKQEIRAIKNLIRDARRPEEKEELASKEAENKRKLDDIQKRIRELGETKPG